MIVSVKPYFTSTCNIGSILLYWFAYYLLSSCSFMFNSLFGEFSVCFSPRGDLCVEWGLLVKLLDGTLRLSSIGSEPYLSNFCFKVKIAVVAFLLISLIIPPQNCRLLISSSVSETSSTSSISDYWCLCCYRFKGSNLLSGEGID